MHVKLNISEMECLKKEDWLYGFVLFVRLPSLTHLLLSLSLSVSLSLSLSLSLA